MTVSKVSGHAVSTRPALENGSCIKLITGLGIRIIFLSTVVHASSNRKLQLICEEKNNLSAIYDEGDCSVGQTIFVTRVQGYRSKNYERCENPIAATEAISLGIRTACNGRDKCETSRLDNKLCETYKCFLVSFTCNNSAEESASQPATDATDRDRGVTKRGNNGTNETAKTNKDSMDMYIVTIVVVSVVAIVATVFAVTLCLLFFCCQKSPLYRRSTTVHRSPQQQQEEYDYVDESKFQALKPSPGNNAQDHGVICVSPAQATTTGAYHNTVKSEDDDYEEISSNESLGPPKRTSPSSQTSPSLIIVSLQSELMRSIKSKAGFPRLEDQNNSSPNLQNHYTRHAIDETPAEYSSVRLSPTSHTSAASSTDQINPVINEVSGRHGDVLAVSLQQELYNPESSPCPSSSSARPVAGEATEDYSHLARPGEAIRNTENVYDG